MTDAICPMTDYVWFREQQWFQWFQWFQQLQFAPKPDILHFWAMSQFHRQSNVELAIDNLQMKVCHG